MANKIQIRRGLKANLPSLDVGEPALCTDTKEVFVGNSGGNVALINKEIMDEHLQDYTLQIPYAAATGSANIYKVILDPAPAAYVDGLAVAVKVNVQNTGASTININGLGAKSIKKANGNNVAAGNLKAGSIYSMRYNGTNFILQGSDSAGDATPADVLFGKTFSNDGDTEITGTMPIKTGDNAALSTSVAGKTLKLRVPSGYYNGSTSMVTVTDVEFVASNIRAGRTLFGIIGTATVINDDTTGSPGSSVLIAGDMDAGYFGTYTGLYTGRNLASACGLPTDDPVSYYNTNITWLKFAYEGKILFVAQQPIFAGSNWTTINNAGCVYGKNLYVGGKTYKCRLMKGGNGDPSSAAGGEWDALMYPIHESDGSWANFTDTDLRVDYRVVGTPFGTQTICMEKRVGSPGSVYRGYLSITSYGTHSVNDSMGNMAWRPVLEVV